MKRCRIVPAIDLIDGRCVRLSRGEFTTSEVVADNPVEMAKVFESHGFTRLHVVDLSGARSGVPQHLSVIEEIAQATKLTIDFSGGIRTEQSLKCAFDSGASYVVVGSAAIADREEVRSWMDAYGSRRFILGFDVLDGFVRIKGWEEATTVSLKAALACYSDQDLYGVMSTDISRDGMLLGPAVEMYQRLHTENQQLSIIASGGVAQGEDIRALAAAGVSEIIVGKALYTGSLCLADVKEFIW